MIFIDPLYGFTGWRNDLYSREAMQLYHSPFADSRDEMIQPDDVFGKFVADQDCIQTREARSPILTDMTPWLEYYFFRPPMERPLRCG